MNTNRNGIPVIMKKKRSKRKPLDIVMDTIVMWKIIDGARKEIEVAQFDPLIKVLRRNRWRYENES